MRPGNSALAFFPLLRKRKWCLRLLSVAEGTVEEHFLWGCPSGSCCLSLLTSCRLQGSRQISCLSLENICYRKQRHVTAESRRQESLETLLSHGSLLQHGSARATEIIRYKERHQAPLPQESLSQHRELNHDQDLRCTGDALVVAEPGPQFAAW